MTCDWRLVYHGYMDNLKSLAQVWMCSRQLECCEPSSGYWSMYGTNEDQQAQVDFIVLYLWLEYRYAVLSRGMQHMLNDKKIKSALRKPMWE